MLYRHSIDHCLEEKLGAHGASRAHIDAALKKLSSRLTGLQQRAKTPDLASPLIDLASRTDDVAAIKTLAQDLQKKYRNVVVAGTGGSGLSGRSLLEFRPITPINFHFLENIDPDMMEALLARINVEETCFLVISKSGTTAETLSQFYVLFDYAVEKLGAKAASERFVIITAKSPSPLRQAATEQGLRIVEHESDIGGRFSVLTSVGLLPAAIAGIDIEALRRGAQSVVTQLNNAKNPSECEPALGAALQYAFMEKKYPLNVMLPYGERLSGLSDWYRQSWSESLGKQGKGSTPIRAIGTTDQHSQLQLYLDGPKDKLFTLITLKRAGQGRRINAPEGQTSYLRHKTLGDVMAAEQKATFETLLRNHCPVRLFALDVLQEEQLGALFMHFMLEIIFTAELLGVNPFDQPAVEEGKLLAREYLLKGNM